MIDTAQVRGRRTLRFDTLDAMFGDARALVAAEVAGSLARLGNWTVGQALNHVAAWIEYPYLGYPPELVIPEEMKAGAKAVKQRLMTEPMRAGEKLPGLAAGTLATEEVPAAVGLARLEKAAELLRRGEPGIPDPAFGRVTAREWTEMTLRHAELHLSFFVPR
jgi:hypothetical protein